MLFHGGRKLDAKGEVDRFWMTVDAGVITATGSGTPPPSGPHAGSADTVDLAGRWLVPGFIDLHGHGGGGHSFDGSAADIRSALAVHRAHGTTRSVISLVTAPLAELHSSLGTIADLVADDPLILGSHLEGPFLSAGNRGAHDPSFLRSPEPAEVEALIGAGRGTLRQLTIAPELTGAFEAMDVLVEAGVAVAIGHTEVSFDLARRAFDRGARILTHAFNAMPGIHHRAPGPVIAAFQDERVVLELILDGKHVHQAVAMLAFEAAPDRIALITDAMAAAGSVDGDYMLGSLNVTVRDGLATVSGTSTIAGSTLTQDSAFRRAMQDVRVSPRRAIAALTQVPARALGLDHRLGLLAPGYVADAVALDHEFQVSAVWADGERI